MTIKERRADVYADEDRTKPISLKSYEISGVKLRGESAIPVVVRMTGQPPLYLVCSHLGSDLYLGHPIKFRAFVRLKWGLLWQSGGCSER